MRFCSRVGAGILCVIGLITISGCTSSSSRTVTDPTQNSGSGIQITVRLAGSGTGTVTANPPGPTYASGTTVVLTATPGQSSFFTGWTAPCPTALPGPLTCTLTVTSSVSLFAQFDLN